MEDERKRLLAARAKYSKLMADAEASELSIENALLEHEKGNLSIEAVQKTTTHTMNIKFKAEHACQDYKRHVDSMNTALGQFEDDYKPVLQML